MIILIKKFVTENCKERDSWRTVKSMTLSVKSTTLDVKSMTLDVKSMTLGVLLRA